MLLRFDTEQAYTTMEDSPTSESQEARRTTMEEVCSLGRDGIRIMPSILRIREGEIGES